MNFYYAYGQSIGSTLPLPELKPVPPGQLQVTLTKGKASGTGLSHSSKNNHFSMSGQQAYMYWPPAGAFLVRHGREIVVEPAPEAADKLIRLPLLGVVFAALLRQQGRLVLHASAVMVNGQAVAFIGSKGRGKSTLAAALHTQGHTLLADDLGALALNGPAQARLLPAFPQLKLWPDSAAALGLDRSGLEPLHAGVQKLNHRIDSRFLETPVTLKKVFVLDDGPEPEIVPIPAGRALLELITHSRAALFGKSFFDCYGASQFLHCSKLLKTVSIYRLKRPRSLSQLPTVVRLVERCCQA